MGQWSGNLGLRNAPLLVLIGSVLVCLTGCTPVTETSSPIATSADVSFGSPLEAAEAVTGTVPRNQGNVAFDSPIPIATVGFDRHRSVTALESLTVAMAAAGKWNPDAVWYGIVPYTAMERAFALPLDDNVPSWFFRFQSLSAGSEYVVEVLDGKLRGVNETNLPDYVAPLLNTLLAIGPEKSLLDSVDVLKKYESHASDGDQQSAFTPDYFDFALVHPKGKSNPIWTLYNAQDLTAPILIVDAVTGELLAEP